jgi:uncharacterized protein
MPMFDQTDRGHRQRMALMIAAVLVIVIFAAGYGRAQTFPDRGRLAVVDAANVIPDSDERALNERIVAWVNASGHQLVVVTVPSLQGYDIKDFGYKLGRTWGLGHRGNSAASDGVILLLAPAERKVRIEVGYGLEPVLTDALTASIIQETIVPRLKEGDISHALSDGAGAIMEAATPPKVLATDAVPQLKSTPGHFPWGLVAALVGGLGLLGVARFFIRRRQRSFDDYVSRQREAIRDRGAESLEEASLMSEPVTALDVAFANSLEKRGGESVAKRSAGVFDIQRNTRPIAAFAESAPKSRPTPKRVEESPRASPSYSSNDSSSSPSYDFSSSSSSSSSSSDDSSSSSSGFDSGGGSFGGGGSDSSY